MSDHGHVHGAGCSHGHGHGHDHGMKIKNANNLDIPAEADIDLDAMHPEVQIPMQQYALTEEELRDDFVMLTEDGGIKKKIITESKEKELGSPPNGSKVICHYTGTLPNNNNDKFDSSRDRGEPFEFKIGQGQVIKGWDIGIASMKKGERCILRCASPYAYGANGSPPKIPGDATLDFDVELIDWDDWNSCDGAEGQISKKILVTSSSSDDVSSDCKINCTYRIYYINNGIDQILCERKKFNLIVDDDDRFCSAFHLALKSMKQGEKSVFKILDSELLNYNQIYCHENELKTDEFEYNNNKQQAPADKITYYEIIIHNIIEPKPMYNAQNSERIMSGIKYKENGNTLFKQQRFFGAIKKYEKALNWVDIDFSDEKLNQQKIDLVISCNNNLALIYIKQKNWSTAIEHSNKVLENDENNLKGLMRRGQARLMEGYLDLSKKDLKKALSFDKNNSYVKKLLKICTQKHKEYIEKQQKLYAGMFGKSTKKNKKKKKVTKEKQKENDQNNDNKNNENDTDKAAIDKMEVDTDKAVQV